jgi:hypothetical protein
MINIGNIDPKYISTDTFCRVCKVGLILDGRSIIVALPKERGYRRKFVHYECSEQSTPETIEKYKDRLNL